jgi:hypothetical protein
MPAPRILPTTDILLALRRPHHRHCPLGDACTGKAHSYAEIAEMYGVTKGAVFWQLREAGKTRPATRYERTLPWAVTREHTWAYPAMMLRLWGRELDGRGDEIPADKRALLDSWVERMRAADLVVAYHPDVLPNPASQHGGFAYVPRVATDEPDNFVSGASVPGVPGDERDSEGRETTSGSGAGGSPAGRVRWQ